jgi:hypothetical protein
METIADYKARILSYIEGKDPLEVQRKTPELLADLVVQFPERKLYERYVPPKSGGGRMKRQVPGLSGDAPVQQPLNHLC